MSDFSSLRAIAPVASLILLLPGCFVLHFRLRTWPSLALTVSALLLIVVNQAAIRIYGDCAAADAANSSICSSAIALRSMKEWIEPVLLVVIGLSFFASTWSVVRRENSSKAKPNQIR
jgi:chromate transport protein ChrA